MTNKEFTVTASHNLNDVWKVFNTTMGYFWNPGVVVDDGGRYVQPVSIWMMSRFDSTVVFKDRITNRT